MRLLCAYRRNRVPDAKTKNRGYEIQAGKEGWPGQGQLNTQQKMRFL
jgi:hypothetical protein